MGENPPNPLTDFYNTDGSLVFSESIPYVSSSSSSSFSPLACWDVWKSDTEVNNSSNITNVDCMDQHVMETTTYDGYCIDLMEGGSNVWDDDDAVFSDYQQNPSDFQQFVPEQQQQLTVESQDTKVNNSNSITNVDCMNHVMETTTYDECMDRMEGGSDVWDDIDAVFSNYQKPSDFQQFVPEQQQQSTLESQGEISEDLATVFLEWLKSNKESISAEDLRKIKFKRSTIESAIQNFGGGKEGMKKVFKLILEWVQNHHLRHQEKRMRTPDEPSHIQIAPNPIYHPNMTNPNDNNFIVHFQPDQYPCFSNTNWNAPQLTTIPQPPQFSPYAGDMAAIGAVTGFSSVIDFNNPYQHTTSDYSLSAPQYAMPSPTKEARKTRMARQKRVLPHHKHNQSHHGHHH